jgi:ATP-dependent RNA helicase RhlE
MPAEISHCTKDSARERARPVEAPPIEDAAGPAAVARDPRERMTFNELGLSEKVLAAVTAAGYSTPTPIQEKAIPIVLEMKDVCGIAQTGTGKTASFVLPMLTRLESGRARARMPRTLILEPTRELAAQVEENFNKYGINHKLNVALLIGGVSFDEQLKKLDRGVDVLIATPGRLLDLFGRGRLLMSGVEILVIDEADRMLDMGFIPDIRRILAMLPKERQSLLFSATFSDEIKKLADTMLKNPQLIEVARRNTVSETITHRMYQVDADRKRHLLLHMLNDKPDMQALVFVGTKFGTARLATWLERQGVNAVAIHGDKSQQQRTEALEAFKAGTARVMVATDVAARGLDIDDLPHVINYELPHVAEDYVHRIGRTGRAGKLGDATSLVAPEEKPRLNDIERLIKLKIEQVALPEFSTSAFVESDRRGRSGGGHGHSHRDRERHGPKAPVQLPPAASHLPKVAADGFDFGKPYEAKVSLGDTPPKATDTALPKRPLRPVAALLGGLGKK